MLKVDTVCMETQALQMRMIARQLNDISSRVASVNQKLRWNTNISATVRSSLASYSNTISTLDDKASRLAGALTNAANQYIQSENKAELFVTIVQASDRNTSGSSNPVSADGSWCNYEFKEDGLGVTAWVGRASAEYKGESVSADANGYLVKGEAEADADFSLFKTETKKEFKNGKWDEDEKITLINAEVSAAASISLVAGDAKVEAGDDMFGADVEIEAAAGNAETEIKGKFSVGEKGINAYAKGKAMVSAVEGKASGTINILGIEITVKATGCAGALGMEAEAGVKDGDFVLNVGAAAVIGGSVGIEVGLNDEGWSNFNNFVDFITFWD